MKIERELKKVGGSVMVPIPAEILRELRWGPGLKVAVGSEGVGLRIESIVKRSSPGVMEFVAEFFDEYGAGMRELADRWAKSRRYRLKTWCGFTPPPSPGTAGRRCSLVLSRKQPRLWSRSYSAILSWMATRKPVSHPPSIFCEDMATGWREYQTRTSSSWPLKP